MIIAQSTVLVFVMCVSSLGVASESADVQQLRQEIVDASAEASSRNKTETVVCRSIVYDFYQPLTVNSHVSLISEGEGKRSTVFRFRDIQDGDTLVTLRNGNACVFRGISIRSVPSDATNVTGLHVLSMSSSTLKEFEVRLDNIGVGSIGIVHERGETWGESVVLEKFDCRADNPLRIISGDNIQIRDFDMTCLADKSTTGEATAIISAGPVSTPDHWHIGPGSGQRGDHALLIQSDADRVGSGLTVEGVRWEGGTDWGQAAWHVVYTGHRRHYLEFLTISNCRHSQRRVATSLRRVMIFNRYSGYLPGRHRRIW